MILLAGGALFFIAIHLGVSGTAIRDALVRRIGLRGYMIVFSVASVAGMAWLVMAYKTADYVPLWVMPEWWKVVMIALMLPAFVLVVAGLATPNPTAVAQEKLVEQAPRGIVVVTRHPFLVGVSIWAALHLVGNGNLASVLFFAGLLVVSAAGTVSIDAKRRRALGDAAWGQFADRTSIVPFGAVVAGRNRLFWRDLADWRVGVGILVYALMLGGHAHIIGVSPWPAR